MASDASKRRTSVSTRDSSEHATGPMAPATLTPAHRRMSRVDPSFMSHAARRMSVYRRPSLAGSQRTDLSHSVLVPPKLQPTYRLEPRSEETFSGAKVSKALNSILESFLSDEEYEPKKCSNMSQRLTEHIKDRVKDMNFKRYKFVCHVIIGQQGNQGIQATSRCVWDTAFDNFAQGTYSNASLFAVANVYGCYHS